MSIILPEKLDFFGCFTYCDSSYRCRTWCICDRRGSINGNNFPFAFVPLKFEKYIDRVIFKKLLTSFKILKYLGGATGGFSILSPMVLKSGFGIVGDSGGVL